MKGAMNIFIRLLALLCLLLLPVTAMAGGKFLSAVDDLPLMTGLSEDEGGVMVFDSPNGRVVETLATGAVKKADVLNFYSATLPQLGWQEQSSGHFTRDEEVLRLEFPASPGAKTTPLTVRFMLKPAQ